MHGGWVRGNLTSKQVEIMGLRVILLFSKSSVMLFMLPLFKLSIKIHLIVLHSCVEACW